MLSVGQGKVVISHLPVNSHNLSHAPSTVLMWKHSGQCLLWTVRDDQSERTGLFGRGLKETQAIMEYSDRGVN